MEVAPIDQTEFEQVYTGSTARLPETRLVTALFPMSGVKMPCRWKHGTTPVNRSCNGTTTFRTAAKRAGFQVHTRCRDGVVYVFRYE